MGKETRLYYDDPYLTQFKAKIVSSETIGQETRVVLDKTAFYPTSGGQPNDTGTIADVPVIDVVEEGDLVVHITQAHPALTMGLEVTCEVNHRRRVDHMQQHAGQHILSAACNRLYDAHTVGFHLGDEVSTIDLDIHKFTWDMADQIDTLANDIISQNRLISTKWLTSEEVGKIRLRKPTERKSDIRIVEIEGFDISACGGTHPRATGEIGLVKILRWEKIRGNVRLHFVCGMRSVREFALRNRVLVETASLLSTGIDKTVEAAAKLLDQNKSLSRDLKMIKEENLNYLARELHSQSSLRTLKGESRHLHVVVRALAGVPADEVRYLATIMTKEPATLALLAGVTDTAYLVFARSRDLNIDMSALLRKALTAVDGRGGGPPQLAQGGGKKLKGVEAALDIALQALNDSLEG